MLINQLLQRVRKCVGGAAWTMPEQLPEQLPVADASRWSSFMSAGRVCDKKNVDVTKDTEMNTVCILRRDSTLFDRGLTPEAHLRRLLGSRTRGIGRGSSRARDRSEDQLSRSQQDINIVK